MQQVDHLTSQRLLDLHPTGSLSPLHISLSSSQSRWPRRYPIPSRRYGTQLYLQVAPAQAVQPARPVPQAVAQQPAPVPKTSESFGNFADFDSVAFDSMPAGDIWVISS